LFFRGKAWIRERMLTIYRVLQRMLRGFPVQRYENIFVIKSTDLNWRKKKYEKGVRG
jgi:hypothetical protein